MAQTGPSERLADAGIDAMPEAWAIGVACPACLARFFRAGGRSNRIQLPPVEKGAGSRRDGGAWATAPPRPSAATVLPAGPARRWEQRGSSGSLRLPDAPSGAQLRQRPGSPIVTAPAVSEIERLPAVREQGRATRAAAARRWRLGHRIEGHTGDEIEALGQALNRMAERPEVPHAGLERKVADRTRELREPLEYHWPHRTC